MPTSIVEVIELSRDVVETKRENAKLIDRINDPERESEDVQSVEQQTCVNLEATTARRQTVETQVKDTDANYAKVVAEAA